MLFCFRQAPRALYWLGAAACCLWFVTAYITGGTVSRYCLPLLPAIVPGATYVLLFYARTRRFRVYALAYVALVGVALVVARQLQLAAL